jgi:hypothetical protein
MSKIINTLKKGTSKAKMVVILAVLASIASLAFIGLAVAFKQLLYFFGTVICAFIAISLKQTLDVYEYQGTLYADENARRKRKKGEEENEEPEGDDVENEETDEEQESDEDVTSLLDKMDELLAAADTSEDFGDMLDEAEDEGEEAKEDENGKENGKEEKKEKHKKKHKGLKFKKKDKNKKSKEESEETVEETVQETAEDTTEAEPEEIEPAEENAETEETAEEIEEETEENSEENLEEETEEEASEEETEENNTKEKKHHKKFKKIKKKKQHAEKPEDKGKTQEDILEDELEKDLKFLKNNISGDFEEEEESKNLLVVKQASEETIASYDRKKVKKTLHKYKVKRDHRMIIIDYCDKYYIKECPAYVWISNNDFNILLIEEEPRHLVLPVYSIKEITYLKKVEANVDTDYPVFHKKTLLTDTFKPYLPDYTQSTVMTDLRSYKNLYGFGPGIYCTNRSAKNLFDLLSVEFRVDDKVTMSNKVNIYFKDCYKSGILLRDNVIDANGYANRISDTLDDMAKSSLSYNEFKETLNLLVRNKIITQEFATHYMDVRDKIRRT